LQYCAELFYFFDALNCVHRQHYFSLYLLQGNIQNQLIQFELLLTAATLVAAVFAAVAGVFGMNFETTVFDYPSGFNLVLVITGIVCIALYFAFLFYFRYKKVLAA